MKGDLLLVDSFAWLEILKGTEKGKTALELMKGKKLLTSVANLYEVHYRVAEIKDTKTARRFIEKIKIHAKVTGIDEDTALEAAKIKLESKRRRIKIGAVDCLIYATARLHGAGLLTGDDHFKDLENVLYLE
ncbi:MAG: type II toxin-antitoxin system VapC family toxin [Methanobacteriota archaeon]|nr:MAG: type II toxin-antitoxin system VapC family toxin [Euryarchaeota archaeon]